MHPLTTIQCPGLRYLKETLASENNTEEMIGPAFREAVKVFFFWQESRLLIDEMTLLRGVERNTFLDHRTRGDCGSLYT